MIIGIMKCYSVDMLIFYLMFNKVLGPFDVLFNNALPVVIIALIQMIFIPFFLWEVDVNYLLDLMYGVCLFIPYICMVFLPEITRIR
jgi:hypothetical protein